MPKAIHERETFFPLLEGKSVPYQPHSSTSRAAAATVKPKAGTQRAIVLEHIQSRSTFGVADFEGIRDLKPSHPSMENAYRARRIELAEAKLIRKRAVGRTSPAGLLCDVWIGSEVNDITEDAHV